MTSIIHPDYALSEKMRRRKEGEPVKSPMRGVNDVMTVTQLIDLIAFLQPQYRQIPPLIDFSYPLSVWTD